MERQAKAEEPDNGIRIWLEVKDPGEASRFYSEVLGWERLSGGGDGFCLLRLPDGKAVGLIRGDAEDDCLPHSADGKLASGGLLYVRVPDIAGWREALVARIDASGAPFSDIEESGGPRTLTITTPEGYRIAYWQTVELAEDDLLELYAAGPERLEAAVSGLGEAELDWALAPGKWTIRQQVLHIVDLELAAAHKLKFILASSNPAREYRSTRFDQDEWAAGMVYHLRPIADEVALFRQLRRHLLALLAHLPDGLKRSVTNSAGKTETAARLLQAMTGHAAGHMRRVEEIRRLHE